MYAALRGTCACVHLCLRVPVSGSVPFRFVVFVARASAEVTFTLHLLPIGRPDCAGDTTQIQGSNTLIPI